MIKLWKLGPILVLAASTVNIYAATVNGGQADTTSTTLSAALLAAAPGTSPGQVCIASATSVVLPSLEGNTSGSFLFVDKEAMKVTSQGSTSTCYNVRRGALGTSAQFAHANAATVWVGAAATSTGDNSRPFTGGPFVSVTPTGPCTASLQPTLPLINTGDTTAGQEYGGQVIYCKGGFWVVGEGQLFPTISINSAATTLLMPNPISTTTFTNVSGKLWYSQLQVPVNSKTTGACVLNGTVGTDKVIYALWDGAGNLIANTALAGTNTATNSKYQCIAWVTPVTVQGPSTYFIGIQGNGTTDTWQAYATGGAPTNYATGVQTGGAFGTILNIATPASTFTTATGVLATLY